MVNRGIFQAQLAVIMDKLTKAAVAEIGKVADECSAAMHSEVFQHKNEIEALKKKCYLLEIELRASRNTHHKATGPSGIRASDEFNPLHRGK